MRRCPCLCRKCKSPAKRLLTLAAEEHQHAILLAETDEQAS